MTIKDISKEEFDGYGPARADMAQFLAEEVGWYSDTGGKIIGVMFRDRTDNDWGWAIPGRDEKGAFRCFDMEVSLEAENDARKRLTAKMVKIAASGQTIFPQGE